MEEKVGMEESSFSSLTYVKTYGVAHQLQQLYQPVLRQLILMNMVWKTVFPVQVQPASLVPLAVNQTLPTSSTEVNVLEEDQDQENKHPMGSTLKERGDLLNTRLKGYRQKKLKRKLSVDAQLLNIAQEDMEIKKRIITKIEEMDKQQAENMKKMTLNMEQLTGSIVEGFAMLRQVMLQPCAMPPQFAPPIGYRGMYERMPGQRPTNSPRNMENDMFDNQFTQSQFQHDNF